MLAFSTLVILEQRFSIGLNNSEVFFPCRRKMRQVIQTEVDQAFPLTAVTLHD